MSINFYLRSQSTNLQGKELPVIGTVPQRCQDKLFCQPDLLYQVVDDQLCYPCPSKVSAGRMAHIQGEDSRLIELIVDQQYPQKNNASLSERK